MMKKITMTLMMFALMALLVACGAKTMKKQTIKRLAISRTKS